MFRHAKNKQSNHINSKEGWKTECFRTMFGTSVHLCVTFRSSICPHSFCYRGTLEPWTDDVWPLDNWQLIQMNSNELKWCTWRAWVAHGVMSRRHLCVARWHYLGSQTKVDVQPARVGFAVFTRNRHVNIASKKIGKPLSTRHGWWVRPMKLLWSYWHPVAVSIFKSPQSSWHHRRSTSSDFDW